MERRYEVFSRAARLARGLTVYRGILRDPACRAFLEFLHGMEEGRPAGDLAELYGEMFYRLSMNAAGSGEQAGDAWQDHLINLILMDDNAFTRGAAAARLENLGRSLVVGAAEDLRRLQALYGIGAAMAVEAVISGTGDCSLQGLAAWEDLNCGVVKDDSPDPVLSAVKRQMAQASDWGEQIPALAAFHATNGSGIFAAFRAFRWSREGGRGRLMGIAEPDFMRLDDLVGYGSQRAEVMANTEMFLAGCPANNVLLYGDRGTGKSSTVKALLHEYSGRGLRMVEVAKKDLRDFNRVTEVLRQHPQRFIIFVDDLSFEETEVEYKELKAILEGGLESRPSNVLICATSNRRHLVREFFTDRNSAQPDHSEIRRNETVQEKLSLVDRFGLTVLFTSPDRTLYLEIVKRIAGKRGLNIGEEELTRRALLWEVQHNGRSGRTARQFINHLTGEYSLKPAIKI
ncbi:MAG: DUF815 domain-containing protein [Eubacteriales bacterium]